MAEGAFSIINKPIDQFVLCNHCLQPFQIDPGNGCLLSHVEDYLTGLSYTAAVVEYLDEYYFDTAYVSCNFICSHCKKDFKTVAQVSARPIWNHDDMMEGKVARISHFEDVEILNFSICFETTNSIQECFKCDIDFNEDVELNAQNVIGSDVVPSSIILKIIAKTNMNKGFCYLGLDESTGRIFRPILNNSDQQCCWPQNEQLMLGLVYNFNVKAFPNPNKYFTPFPHRNEDMLVCGFVRCGLPVPTSVYPSFLHYLAKNDIEDIFKDVKKKRYVNENTQCSSVGILRSSAYITYHEIKKKRKCRIECKSGVYVLPLTAIQYDDIGCTSYTDAVIVLGLARPFKGNKNEYKPARCYLLVLGIYLPKYLIPLLPNQWQVRNGFLDK